MSDDLIPDPPFCPIDPSVPYEKYDPPPWRWGSPAWDLRGLELKFHQDRNPAHVWHALTIIEDFKMPMPKWVVEYLFAGAREINRMRADAAQGKRLLRQAERVGKALGFGAPGQGGPFQDVVAAERDAEIFHRIIAMVMPHAEHTSNNKRRYIEEKLSESYILVAKEMNLSRSVVIGAAHSHLSRLRARETAEGDEHSTMERYVEYLKALNPGLLEMMNTAFGTPEATNK